MKTYVVAEGPPDAALLQRIVDRVAPGPAVAVVAARGKSSASSLATSLLARRGDRVVLAVDADTSDEKLVAQQQADLEAALGMVAPASSYRVVLFVPELEALLLHDDVLREAGYPHLAEHDRELARYAPREVLTRTLGGRSRSDFVNSLSDSALDRLASSRELGPLLEFLTRRAA